MIRRPLVLVLAGLLSTATIALPLAQQSGDGTVVPLSDPARPALVRAHLMNGGITVRGENRKDVLVITTGDDVARGGRGRRAPDPPPTGLRRLTQGAGLSVSEENNQITITGAFNRGADIEIRVPARTNLNLTGLNGDDTIVENVEGEIEVSHQNAGLRLTNVAGSVVANSHNGDVRVVLTRLTSDKAMAFTSFNGNVDVTLPATAKANLAMRSDNGDIYTDFDVQTSTAPAPRESRSGRARVFEINQSIIGAINGGGPEFELRTFNGNIYVRRAAQP